MLDVVPADRLATVVGTHAATSLLAGSLLTPEATTDQLLPGGGMSLVGVALDGNQVPAESLLPGDTVRVVDTPPPWLTLRSRTRTRSAARSCRWPGRTTQGSGHPRLPRHGAGALTEEL